MDRLIMLSLLSDYCTKTFTNISDIRCYVNGPEISCSDEERPTRDSNQQILSQSSTTAVNYVVYNIVLNSCW